MHELRYFSPNHALIDLILEHVFGLASTKDVDLHLTVGEALAKCGAATPSDDSTAAAANSTAATETPATSLPPLPSIVPPKKVGVAVDGTSVAIGPVAQAAAAGTSSGTRALVAPASSLVLKAHLLLPL